MHMHAVNILATFPAGAGPSGWHACAYLVCHMKIFMVHAHACTVITWAWTNSCNKYNPFYRIFIGYAHAYPVVCMCILCVLFLEKINYYAYIMAVESYHLVLSTTLGMQY